MEKEGPKISGTMSAYKPQWKHSTEWGKVINQQILGPKGGDDWTDVPFTIIRGAVAVKFGDKSVPVGIPFPMMMPGILESIYLCGYEQAMALAWTFAAGMAASGGEVEVRVDPYDLQYEIKTQKQQPNKA